MTNLTKTAVLAISLSLLSASLLMPSAIAQTETTTAAPPPRGIEDKLKTDEKKTAAATPPQTETVVDSKAASRGTVASQPAAVAKEERGPLLESIKFDGTSPKGEMIKFKLNGFYPPVVHGVVEGIPRVICDFNNTQLADSAKNIVRIDGKHIKVIRTTRTKKPEKVRVVLDLEPNRSYDLQQVFFKEDNLFVIIVNTVKK